MTEIADYDARRAWDAFYSRSAVLPDEPEPLAQACVDVLRDLADDGPALELAVGHGRIAIPLAASGVAVDGIDISPKAIELIRAHPQGGAINASVADISDFALDRNAISNGSLDADSSLVPLHHSNLYVCRMSDQAEPLVSEGSGVLPPRLPARAT